MTVLSASDGQLFVNAHIVCISLKGGLLILACAMHTQIARHLDEKSQATKQLFSFMESNCRKD